MAIIDYLQTFNLRKKLEYFFKAKVFQGGKDLISCVPASNYAQRFYKFMKAEVIIDDMETIQQREK